MAKLTLSSGFQTIPEGNYVFYIYKVDYDEVFGRMEVYMITAEGLKHRERFSLKDSNDGINEKAMNAFSYFAKTALNDFTVEEIDQNDLVGHYIRADINHTVQPNRKDPTKTVTFANMGDKSPADGFDTEPTAAVAQMIGAVPAPAPAPAPSVSPSKAPASASSFDLDSLLG